MESALYVGLGVLSFLRRLARQSCHVFDLLTRCGVFAVSFLKDTLTQQNQKGNFRRRSTEANNCVAHVRRQSWRNLKAPQKN